MSLSSTPVPSRSAVSLHKPATALPFARSTAAVFGATALLALCAHIMLPLPFTPVPGTMQTFAVLVLGITMGPVLGPTAMLLYLLEGSAGLPVFAPTAMASAALLGPTFGYLLSYSAAAWVAATAFRHLRPFVGSFAGALAAGVLASLPIFAIGAGWLGIALHLSPHRAIELGVLPFLPGEAVKLSLAAVAVDSLHRLRPIR